MPTFIGLTSSPFLRDAASLSLEEGTHSKRTSHTFFREHHVVSSNFVLPRPYIVFVTAGGLTTQSSNWQPFINIPLIYLWWWWWWRVEGGDYALQCERKIMSSLFCSECPNFIQASFRDLFPSEVFFFALLSSLPANKRPPCSVSAGTSWRGQASTFPRRTPFVPF